VISLNVVQKPVRHELGRVQTHLRRLFRTPIPILNQVGGHVLATRGKKFRPTLLLLVAKTRGPVREEAVLCATVVEMVHAAALIHDDSVDKSGLRRGVPTVNGLWTDEMAIIMGDYLYAQAMATLVTHGFQDAMGVLARVVTEMSCGEALEFQYAYDTAVTEEKYLELILNKTGSLIGAATEIGTGLRTGKSEMKERERYRRFGEKLGVAFQIADDLFDYLAEPEVTGKPVGADLADGKITLPLIAALQLATERDRKALRTLAVRRKWTPDQWARLRALVERAGGFAYARRRAQELADEARGLLNGERQGPARRALDHAIDYAVNRDH
jgi:octaprenyl-diphosphate synthase